MSKAETFYTHLDKCQQCEQHPHELCAIGQQLLMETPKDRCRHERLDMDGICRFCGEDRRGI